MRASPARWRDHASRVRRSARTRAAPPEHAGLRQDPGPSDAVQQAEAFQATPTWQTTPLDGQPGDWLITDQSGEQWPVAEAIFASTYRHLDGDQCVKTAGVHAVQLDEPFVVNTLEGTAQGRPGDYLVQGPAGEAWPMSREKFEATYRLAAS